MKSILLALLIPALAITGCEKKPTAQALQDKRKGELTRDLAAEILNQQLAKPHLTQIAFLEGALDRAKKDGIIIVTNGTVQLSPKWCAILLVPKGWSGLTAEGSRLDKISALAERVAKVTGISPPGSSVTICEVDYITEFLIPAGAKEITQYIGNGQETKATFKKYDDGWRVETTPIDVVFEREH